MRPRPAVTGTHPKSARPATSYRLPGDRWPRLDPPPLDFEDVPEQWEQLLSWAEARKPVLVREADEADEALGRAPGRTR